MLLSPQNFRLYQASEVNANLEGNEAEVDESNEIEDMAPSLKVSSLNSI